MTAIVQGITAIVAAVPGIIIACATYRKILRNETAIQDVRAETQQIHRETNSMREQLVQTTGEAQFAKGKLEGKDEAVAASVAAAATAAALQSAGLVAHAQGALDAAATAEQIAAKVVQKVTEEKVVQKVTEAVAEQVVQKVAEHKGS